MQLRVMVSIPKVSHICHQAVYGVTKQFTCDETAYLSNKKVSRVLRPRILEPAAGCRFQRVETKCPKQHQH